MSSGKSGQFYCPHGGSERILSSGRPLASGDRFELTAEEQKEPHNKRLIEEGHILAVPKSTGGDS